MTPFEQGAIVILALSLAAALLVALLDRRGERLAREIRRLYRDIDEMQRAAASLGLSPEESERLDEARQAALQSIADRFEAETGVPLATFEASLEAANLPSGYRDDKTFLSDLGISPE